MAPVIERRLREAHQYLLTLKDEQDHKKRREVLRDSLKSWLINMEPDESGNYIYEFPKPVCIDDTWYTGIMAQRRVSEYTNEDRAKELIAKYGLESRCLEQVVTVEINLDELYGANQEGILSDEEIDSIIDTEENYSLIKVRQ